MGLVFIVFCAIGRLPSLVLFELLFFIVVKIKNKDLFGISCEDFIRIPSLFHKNFQNQN